MVDPAVAQEKALQVLARLAEHAACRGPRPHQVAHPVWDGGRIEALNLTDGHTIELGERAIWLQRLAAPEWNEPGGTESRKTMIELVHGRTVRCERGSIDCRPTNRR